MGENEQEHLGGTDHFKDSELRKQWTYGLGNLIHLCREFQMWYEEGQGDHNCMSLSWEVGEARLRDEFHSTSIKDS